MVQVPPIAVIGVSCRMPGGDGIAEYWKLISSGSSAIRELPADRLDKSLYFDTEQGKPGRCYTDLGGVVTERPVNRQICPISDKDLQTSDTAHLTLCEVASSALKHAGMDPAKVPYRRTGVYVGHSGGSCLGGDAAFARYVGIAGEILRKQDEFKGCSPSARAEISRRMVDQLRSQFPDEESLKPMNFAAANAAMLISRVHGFEGPSLVIDAACASSLMALSQASYALARGEIDMAVAGGASYSKWFGLVLFSMAMSISATGSRPFDADADGLISSDGYGLVVLKTLPKALADGDRILSVIRGIGVSSDGRGKSLWAPRQEGQILAVERAYSKNIDPASLQYIECHATSTQVGDATELKSLAQVLTGKIPAGRKIPIGSVKANIGHALEAAGIAGFIKTVLAMEHGVIPPQINFKTPNPEIEWKNVPFEVATNAREWDRPAGGMPRRAAVNSFGIGGLNVHMVLDDGLLPGEKSKTSVAVPSAQPNSNVAPAPVQQPMAVIGMASILPGALTKAALWEALIAGKDPKCEFPKENSTLASTLLAEEQKSQKPELTSRGGYVADFVYDWKRHKVPPKQVANANPLQFMLLDAADQALTDAGYEKKPFDRNRSTVIVGTMFGGDFAVQLQLGLRLPHIQKVLREHLEANGTKPDQIDEALLQYEKHFLKVLPALLDETGSFTSSTLASRLSKTFDFRGGAFALEAEEVSGLVAVNLGINMLETGTTDLVLCAAGHQSMSYNSFEKLVEKDLLSKGQSRSAFDADFDGILPAEGVAVLVLKRLADAERDGDTIRAVIRGTGQCNRRNDEAGALRESFNTALKVANTSPKAIGAIEVSGVDCKDRNFNQLELAKTIDQESGQPQALIGSLTPQIGYLRGASGVASIVKSILELQNGQIAPQFGLKKLAAEVQPVAHAIPQKVMPLYATAPGEKGQIAISNSSLDGSGFSLILESAQKLPLRPVTTPSVAISQPASAKQAPATLSSRQITSQSRRSKLALAFPGQGSYYAGMGADLIANYTEVRQKLAEFNEVLKLENCPDFETLSADPGNSILNAQLSMLVIDLLYYTAYKTAGIQPDYVCGHSYGEFPALVAAGALTFRSAVIATRDRSHVVEEFAGKQGTLLAVSSDASTLRHLLTRAPVEVFIANMNSPEQTVLGGTIDDLKQFEKILRERRIGSRLLKVPAAYHTPLLEPALVTYRDCIRALPISVPQIPVISGIGNREVTDPEEIRENLVMQLVSPMDFVGMVQLLRQLSVGMVVEVGPRKVLTQLIQKTANEGQLECLPMDPRDNSSSDWQSTLRSKYEGSVGNASPAAATPQKTPASPVPAQAQKPVSQPQKPAVQPAAANSSVSKPGQTKSCQINPTPATTNVPTTGSKVTDRPRIVHFDATAKRKEENRLRAIQQRAESGRPVVTSASPKTTQNSPAISHSDLAETNGHSGHFEKNGHASDVTSKAPALNSAQMKEEIVPPVVVIEEVPAAPRKLPNRAELEAFVVEYIVDQTGYPPEMVELEADLEADLGIDSIKKAQMLGECAQKFELHWLANEVADLSLDQFPNLASIIKFLTEDAAKATASPSEEQLAESVPAAALPAVAIVTETSEEVVPRKLPNRAELEAFVVEYIVDQTGYPPEMVELEADLEADLGIDSIKKAQMLGECAQKFELHWLANEVADLSLDQFPNLASIIKFLTEDAAKASSSANTIDAVAISKSVDTDAPREPAHQSAETLPAVPATTVTSETVTSEEVAPRKLPNRAELEAFVVEYIVDQTGYPPEMVELEADLEADLGIDSIKKAQMLGECAQKFELHWLANEVADLSLDQFPNLASIIKFLTEDAAKATASPAEEQPAEAVPAAALPAIAIVTETSEEVVPRKLPNRAELEAFVVEYIVDQTGYPPEMVELEADLEADLGIDSIKKAQMLGECAQKFELHWLANEVADLSLDQFPNLASIIKFLTEDAAKASSTSRSASHVASPETELELQDSSTATATLTEPASVSTQAVTQVVEAVPAVSIVRESVMILQGSPYEMGFQHGQKEKAAIHGILERQITRYGARLDNMPELDEAVSDPARYFGEDEVAELKGIADGAELPLAFLIGHNLGLCEDYVPGCAQFAVSAQANGGKGMIHAANEDSSLALSLTDCLRRVVQCRIPAHGYRHIVFSVSGQVSGINGTNEKGLTVTSTLLLDRAPRDITAPGDIHPVLIKKILEKAATPAEAIEILKSSKRNGAWGVCISHADTDSLCYVEYDSDQLEVRSGMTRVIGTNHSLLLGATHPTPPHSMHRMDRLQELLAKEEAMGLDFPAAEKTLRDQFDGGRQRVTAHATMNTICRVDNQISVVFGPSEKTIRVTPGSYRKEFAHEFSTLDVDGFFGGADELVVNDVPTNSNTGSSVGSTSKLIPAQQTDLPRLAGLPVIDERVMHRVILRPRLSPLSHAAQKVSLTGKTVVYGFGEVARALISKLKSTGLEVAVIPTCFDVTKLEAEFENLAALKSARNLILVGPRSSDEVSEASASARFLTAFRLCQLWTQSGQEICPLAERSLTFVSFMGGNFGLEGSPANADGGAMSGLAKALRRELAPLVVRTVDFASDDVTDRVVDQLANELSQSFEICEVAYSRGERFVVAARPVPATPVPQNGPTPGSAWIISGGARGVTAVVARELGVRYGVHLHLIGSSPIPELDPSLLEASAEELKALRRKIMSEARERGEVPLDAWSTFERSLEARRNLRDMRQAGVSVTYHCCDISQPDAVEKTVAAIRTFNHPIEGVIHGAGVEHACRFERKQLPKVQKTFDVKVEGARHLAAALEHDPVAYFVGFGSTSGRFGGLGQADYSAASDALAKFCNELGRKNPDWRTIVVHWPPWGEVGMAARPESKLALEAGGMAFMPPQEGVAFLLEELASTSPEPEILIVDKPDGLDLDRTLPELAAWKDFAAAQQVVDASPLLDTVIALTPGEYVEVEVRLNPAQDPFLYDHQHRNAPILPMTFGLETLAQAFRVLLPATEQVTVLDGEIVNPMRFFADRQELAIARIRRSGDSFEGELVTRFFNRKGVLLKHERVLVKARLKPGVDAPDAAKPFKSSMQLKKVQYAETWDQVAALNLGSVFTGPSIRGLTEFAYEGKTFEGIIVPPPISGFAGNRPATGWMLNPAVLDACLIGCDRWAAQAVERQSLPVNIEKVSLYRPAIDGDLCRIDGQVLEVTEKNLRFNFSLWNSKNEIILRVEGFCTTAVMGGSQPETSAEIPAGIASRAIPELKSLNPADLHLLFPVEAVTASADHWEAEVRIEPLTEPLMTAHRFNNSPLLPGAAMVELFAEALQQVLPGPGVARIRNFSIQHSLHLKAALPRRVQVVAHKEADGYRCQLIDLDGGSITLATALIDRVDAANLQLPQLDQPKGSYSPMKYPDMGPLIHGAPLRSLQAMCSGRDDAWAEIVPTDMSKLLGPNSKCQPVIHPAVLDGSFYACGIHAWINCFGRVELPLGFEELLILRDQPLSKTDKLVTRVRYRDSDDKGSSYEISVFDKQKQPVYVVRNYRSVAKGSVTL
ncbi:6-deoxyerythronolide-B synthase., (Acyl-carrier- protein) S-malonyltransferase [Planctopirus limnophila DSM 3776]|uniref:6-deoxyerythronolide-B synthase., (Acyl-carrier-protein) S-malonyltransferase n=1 Tax=Planctopirus limnophila (strain ATCC 43296 / DSM 3776 / IFAM 1008 / Mu 290) TaxID=521674 RepID=D5SX03_PLAL2|nr:type I polyketide synthase [Planctopirus limnophila]ADG67503.1 6-deoxyerythronolide-B synthase., (Acyl-carrier- protein) S-malonyltransferase [Planctopirus limnophila DSM 3776]